MNQSKEVQQKTLFVGNKRICQQVAYVLDVQDYLFTEKLTKKNLEQYRDSKIYVCAFMCKSRKFVQFNNKVATQLNIQYLDDICRAIDDEYYANRERHANDLPKPVAEKTPPKSIAVATVTEQVVQPVDVIPTKPSLLKRICRGMKHPLRAGWHVVLRTKETLKRQSMLAKQRHREMQELRAPLNRQKQIRYQVKHGNLYYLQSLKPSEILIYVLQAPIKKNIHCTRLENTLSVVSDGRVKICCSVMFPFGNLLYDGELDEIYNSTCARIVKLSSLNRSYCLCDFSGWCKGYINGKGHPLPTEKWETNHLPERIQINFDPACNLCCKSCRTKPYVMDEISQQRNEIILKKLLRSGWLEQVRRLRIAGNGEVFYSPYYRQLLTTDFQRKRIDILSNGTLFNQDNWRLVAGKYSSINVDISVDAATAETYQKLRGADFNNLMKNLNMLADLRRQKQIRYFGLNFVVQRDNFHEMPDFVRLGQSLGVDCVQFQRLCRSSSITQQAVADLSLIIDNEYLDYDLWRVLQDPIFRNPIVDLQGLQRYIDVSEKRYRKRYTREQKQHRSV